MDRSPAVRTATKWCVFSGGPSSGKTTIIDLLAVRGYKVVPEAARVYVQRLLDMGEKLDDLRQDPLQFQTGLVKEKVRAELDLVPDELVFLDRAMPDSLAYYELYGLDSQPILPHCQRFHYHKVFMFERLSWERDGIRVEDDEKAAFLERQLEDVYKTLGYEPFHVPAMPVEDRLNFVLGVLQLS
jgi:predicted ATPase